MKFDDTSNLNGLAAAAAGVFDIRLRQQNLCGLCG